MKGEGRAGKEWEGWFLILLFSLSMMSPVEPGLPHACLSPQTQHATLFPMQFSTMSAWAVSAPSTTPFTQRRTHTDRPSRTFPQQRHIRSNLQHQQPFQINTFFIQQHNLIEPEVVISHYWCVWSRRSEREQQNLKMTGKITWKSEYVVSTEWPYQHSLSPITCSRGNGTWISKVHFIITTTTAPPTGGQKNSKWSD